MTDPGHASTPGWGPGADGLDDAAAATFTPSVPTAPTGAGCSCAGDDHDAGCPAAAADEWTPTSGWASRQDAALRLQPLDSGRRDPLGPRTNAPVRPRRGGAR